MDRIQVAFKVGDVVRLKSGSPPMTIEAVELEGKEWVVTVEWYEMDTAGNAIRTWQFYPEQLELIRDAGQYVTCTGCGFNVIFEPQK
jgi:uncharacterized protein YodC (DUF2158 family)